MATANMLPTPHCPVCGRAVGDDEVVANGECQKAVHERCGAFECPTRADEPDVGAVEF